ncbi:MAG: hypothetical protein GC159_08070 [Phycisphaera sp.]|nr:hypothetical protein [Phycisphaera sp.]
MYEKLMEKAGPEGLTKAAIRRVDHLVDRADLRRGVVFVRALDLDATPDASAKVTELVKQAGRCPFRLGVTYRQEGAQGTRHEVIHVFRRFNYADAKTMIWQMTKGNGTRWMIRFGLYDGVTIVSNDDLDYEELDRKPDFDYLPEVLPQWLALARGDDPRGTECISIEYLPSHPSDARGWMLAVAQQANHN